jgi:hypothetical protein
MEQEMRNLPIVAPWRIVIALALLFPFAMPFAAAQAQAMCNPVLNLDTPITGTDLAGQVTFSGWALDQSATNGSGIGSVDIVLDAPASAGGIDLGTATQVARPDVEGVMGHPGYGFSLTTDVSGVPDGNHMIYVQAMTACGPAMSSGLAEDFVNPVMNAQTTPEVNAQPIPVPAPSSYMPAPDYAAGTCNPDFPNFNPSFPTNVPCGTANYGMNYGECNPTYPVPNATYPTDIPCPGNTSANTYGGTPTFAECNPTYPVPNVTYPSDIPCPGNTSSVGTIYTPSTIYAPSMVPGVGNYVQTPTYTTGLTSTPSNVSVSQTAPGTATISWNSVSGASSYMVYASTSGAGGPFTSYVTTTNGNTASISGLMPGMTYFFAVASNSSAGMTSAIPANPVTITY